MWTNGFCIITPGNMYKESKQSIFIFILTFSAKQKWDEESLEDMNILSV